MEVEHADPLALLLAVHLYDYNVAPILRATRLLKAMGEDFDHFRIAEMEVKIAGLKFTATLSPNYADEYVRQACAVYLTESTARMEVERGAMG